MTSSSQTPALLRRNLFIGSAFSFFQMFLVFIPVAVPYWQSLGLSMAEIFKIQAIFGLSVVLFEIPTGYIADLYGRKISLCLGSFVNGLAFMSFPTLRNYDDFVIFEILIAFGGSLISGADISIIYDSFSEAGSAGRQRLKLLGSLQFYTLTGEAVASILGGILVLWSFSLVTWTQAVAGWIPFLLTLFFVEPPRETLPHDSHIGNITRVVTHLFWKDRFLTIIFVNYVVWQLAGFCAVWLLQRVWQDAGVPIAYFGYLWAGYLIVSAVVGKAVHPLERRAGASTLLVVLGLASSTAYFLMSFGTAWLAVTAPALLYVARGITSVLLQDALNWRFPAAFRATANSLRSLVFRLGFAILGPLIGHSIDTNGMNTTLLVLGAVSFALFFVVMVPLLRRVRDLTVDYIPD